MRKYNDSRDDQMIGDAVGELQGKVIKLTLTKDNAGGQYYGNYTDPKLPQTEGEQWYVKKDVIGMPSYKDQKGRGTPRAILLVDGNDPTDTAYFSPHYNSFEDLAGGFITRGKPWKTYFSK